MPYTFFLLAAQAPDCSIRPIRQRGEGLAAEAEELKQYLISLLLTPINAGRGSGEQPGDRLLPPLLGGGRNP